MGRDARRRWALVAGSGAALALVLALPGVPALRSRAAPAQLPGGSTVLGALADGKAEVPLPLPPQVVHGVTAFPDRGVPRLDPTGPRPPAQEAAAFRVAAPPMSSEVSGPGTAAFVSYWNDSAAHYRKDGSAALDYQGTPAWVFVWPLRSYLEYGSSGARPPDGSTKAPPPPRPAFEQCTWVSIVDARSMAFLEAFEDCRAGGTPT